MKVSGLAPAEQSNWNRTTTFTAGFVWEEVLFGLWAEHFSAAFARLLARKYDWYQTGEVRRDGIICTPDGLDISDVWTLQEAKFTWKSSKNPPMDNWYYMTQAKGYCKVLSIYQVMMHIFYCMGDYKGNGPQYEAWLIQYQPHEIEENWQMILNHAAYMRDKQ